MQGFYFEGMQMYLQYDELQKSHLDVFDNWVKTFALPEQLCEIDVDTSKYRFVRRFVKFFNLPELSRMFLQVAIFHAVNNKESLPEFGGYTDVVIKKYNELTDFMSELCKRTERIRTGVVDRKFDNMLKVSTDGRKAALDLKLVGKEQPYNQSLKVYNCVNPNSAEDTANFLCKLLIEANTGKVERVIEEAARKGTDKNECKEMQPV